MTDRTKPMGAIAWAERIALGLLLALTVEGYSARADVSKSLAVVIERQEVQALVDEARATHEARLAAIESNRFTHKDGEAMRSHFDHELLSMWKDLHLVKESIPDALTDERERVDRLLEKLEARIRAIEQGR